MGTIRICLSTAVLAAGWLTVQADEVVRWVDEDGVVHFGDRQAAPSQGTETIQIRAANGMDAPERRPARPPAQASMNVAKIERAKLENKKGFRGYNSRPKRREKSTRVPTN